MINQAIRQVDLPILIKELENQNLQKRDFVIPSALMQMMNEKLIVSNSINSDSLKNILNECAISHSNEIGSTTMMELECLEVFHEHIQKKFDIPTKYYNKMLGKHSYLLDQNVSYWLSNSKSNYLLRCFIDKEEKKGYARALLSDNFKIIDNFDIVLTVLEAIKESGLNIQIDFTRENGQNGCDLTERGMYLRFICPDIEIQAPELLKGYKPDGKTTIETGDGIISGFVLRNSEVGLGSMSISPRAKILKCDNGLITSDDSFKKVHLGSKMEEFSTIKWSEDTKQKNLQLIVSQLKDAIKTYTSEDYLGARINEMIEKNRELLYPLDTVRAVTNKLVMTDEKASEIINTFIRSGDMTSFGVAQALTLFAHSKCDNSDEQYKLESTALDIFNNIEDYDKPLPKKSIGTQLRFNN